MIPDANHQLRVFLCHASGDKPAVRELYHWLQAHGVDAWLDSERLLPGQDWDLEIRRVVRAAHVVVVCLSTRSVTKEGYVQKEIRMALDVAEEKPEGTIFIIPVRLEECQVPDRLRRWQWVDLYAERWPEQMLSALQARAAGLGLRLLEKDDGLSLSLPPAIDFPFVRVPAGRFPMGSAEGVAEAYADEAPQHTVFLGEYYIGRYQVTVAQFRAFVSATGYQGTASIQADPCCPAGNVSWHDALAFCQWASRVTAQIVRLPTEAQWEKAARGTDGRLYPWGNEPPDSTRCSFGHRGMAPVGQYSPQGDSPYGCADMAGNVWEWTSSIYEPYPYRAEDGREDAGADGDVGRIVRGG